MAEGLFGSNVKHLLQRNPPAVRTGAVKRMQRLQQALSDHDEHIAVYVQLPNEEELLEAVVKKVGPHADQDKLRTHIRQSAGKVHWAGEANAMMGLSSLLARVTCFGSTCFGALCEYASYMA